MIHRLRSLVALIGWNVGRIEVLVFASSWRIAATAAVSAALEASEALAAARDTTAEAATYAPTYRKDDDTGKDHEPDGSPSARRRSARVNSAAVTHVPGNKVRDDVLAVSNLHTIVPT